MAQEIIAVLRHKGAGVILRGKVVGVQDLADIPRGVKDLLNGIKHGFDGICLFTQSLSSAVLYL